MADTEDLIDFGIIETHKENIQSLPSGRSAKALASVFSPLASKIPFSPLSTTQDCNTAVRAEYERELLTIADADDPLDIYDRYVRWTLSAYPSAQATPQSQLLTLLERATKTFLPTSSSPANQIYKNDPRYLKLWLHYIHLFSDSPRETYSYLARHGVGDALALYYEEFAAWLEGTGRWVQAEEIYKLGIEREARPVERLVRKLGEFERRRENQTQSVDGPSSPALHTVRPALAAKIDPFSAVEPVVAEPQAQPRGASTAKPRRQKLEVFSDASGEALGEVPSGEAPHGWDNIGTLAERKKENTIGARPWAGETLKGGKLNTGMPKMTIFKDESSITPQDSIQPVQDHPSHNQRVVNAGSGRTECVFVNLEAVYPDPANPTVEICFEELRAARRGWLDRDWSAERKQPREAYLEMKSPQNEILIRSARLREEERGISQVAHHFPPILSLNNINEENNENIPPDDIPHDRQKTKTAPKERREMGANRTRKIRVPRIRGETQTIQTNLASPKGPRLRRKKSAEPTMTVHTKAAMDEIYEIFNQPLKSSVNEIDEEGNEDDSDSDDGEYVSASESTGTGRISGTTSEYGDETQGNLIGEKNVVGDEDGTSNDTGWSDFTIGRHVPQQVNNEAGAEEETDTTQIGDLDEDNEPEDNDTSCRIDSAVEELVSISSPSPYFPPKVETHYIPIPPDDDVELPTRPYRDAGEVAQSKLPFMTPIVEKTESSLGTLTTRHEKDYFNSKTPCPKANQKTPTIPEVNGELWSSPFEDVLKDAISDDLVKIPQPVLAKAKSKTAATRTSLPNSSPIKQGVQPCKYVVQKGPIINDSQCNPMDTHVHDTVLAEMQPPLSSFDGYFDHREVAHGRKTEIRKYCASVAKVAGRSNKGSDKTIQNMLVPPVLRLVGAEKEYVVKRELGKGAFAPVYLAECANQEGRDEPNDDESDGTENANPPVIGKDKFSHHLHRRPLEAIKMEEPPSAWEFYMLRTAKRRLGVSRAANSIVHAYEMHLFKDEGYLIEEYREQGTLLDLVNLARAEQAANGVSGGGGMDEMLAMFFAVELLRVVEALHAEGVIHGDLKADNVLVRFENGNNTNGKDIPEELSAQYKRDGTSGWASKGISLIDFGRGIDMRAFRPDVQFVADWETGATDCAEMREMRPWTWQVDYHGCAAILHTMLFGRYIETAVERNGVGVQGSKTYRLKEGLKRYWQTEIWGELFGVLLNPIRHVDGEEGGKMPVVKGLRRCRERMEEWLEGNGERGVGLKGSIRRMEAVVGEKRRKG